MSLLSNALSGLNAANIGLIVAGQNVANEAVPGYSRQGANYATATGAFNGVKVVSVERIVDGFLNDDIWRTQADLGHYQGLQSYVSYLEEVMGTDSLNFNDAIADISAALNAAMTTPESSAYRQQVLSSAEALVQDLAQLNGAMQGQVEKLGKEMQDLSNNASAMLGQIAEFNHKIAQAKANGDATAQLEDAREHMLTELSGMIGVSTHLREDGKLDISTLSGAPLVVGSQFAELTVNGTEITASLGPQSFVLTDKVGGRLGGLIAADVQVLKPTATEMNQLISQLADDVNAALAQGFDLNDQPGAPLFTYNPADPMGTLRLDPAITQDKLAFTGGEFDAGGNWVPAGGPGDNSNIAKLVDAFGGQGEGYTKLIGDLAITSRQIKSSTDTAQKLNDNAKFARDSVSGVNLDEEAANIMHFQQLYQANAKVVATADQLFKTLMTMF